MKILGLFSFAVIACHVAWKWFGAGGTSYPGTFGTLGPVFFIAMLIWPMFVTACVCVGRMLLQPHSSKRSKLVALLFIPIILYGTYFLIFGGANERAGLR